MNIYTNSMSETNLSVGHSSRGDIVKALWQNDAYRAKQHDARLGRIQSESSRKKESIAKKKNWQNPEFRAKMLYVFQSKEYREQLSKVSKGRKISEETKEKMRLAKTNFKNSGEAKIKMSISYRGLRQSKISKIKISNTMKHYLSQNSFARSRLTTLAVGRVATPETRLKLSKANTGKKHTEQTKAKLRELRLNQIIPAKDTSLEIKFQEALNKDQIAYKKHVPLIGQPDIFIAPDICIFLDGCYWHACSICNLNGDEISKSNKRERDMRVSSRLIAQGYKVLRFWEHEIEEDVTKCINFVKTECKKQGS